MHVRHRHCTSFCTVSNKGCLPSHLQSLASLPLQHDAESTNQAPSEEREVSKCPSRCSVPKRPGHSPELTGTSLWSIGSAGSASHPRLQLAAWPREGVHCPQPLSAMMSSGERNCLSVPRRGSKHKKTSCAQCFSFFNMLYFDSGEYSMLSCIDNSCKDRTSITQGTV